MAGLTKKLYNNAPYFIKYILLNIKGYLNKKKRFNKDFKRFLKEHLVLWEADLKTVETYQKEKLSLLLSEAFKYSEWYSSIMKQQGITLDAIESNPMEVLIKMPLLLKDDRKNKVDLIVNSSRETVMLNYTSGTSGTPMVDYLDLYSLNQSFAIWYRFHKVIGIKNNCKQVRLSGNLIVSPKTKKPPFWVYNSFNKQLLMSTYHLTDANLSSYIKKLNTFKPSLIDGYPSAIYILSRFIIKNKLVLNFKPDAIAVTAETLYDYQRDIIESAFNCKVFNQYASSEGSPFITECINGNLHLNTDSGVFEFLNMEGGPAKPGDIAKLVVTSFINYKTPLIRYDIGDTILLASENKKCNCECSMPIIEKIIGREDDILWSEEKGFVGRMDTAYKGLTGIKKSQLIQENPNQLIVNIVVDNDFSDDVQKTLIANLKDRLGENINYHVNIVEEIPTGSNGKIDAVKRNFEINI
ncbi:hypothetical protein V8G56_10910 [Gaetbulibacter aquiaggeris]|uniref:Phenylacetate-CoA ligase n=1 Tax=Gaetbulibacter aquiaggeris TaxID=1735373 RepID=A0ABW7MQW9_9FLAO